MTIRERAAFLLGYYLTGPLFGLNNKIIVADRTPHEPETWMLLLTCILFSATVWISPISAIFKFGWLVVLLPILAYAFAPIEQLVLEYRAYLSTFGIAILAALFADTSRTGRWIMIALAGMLLARTQQRLTLFAHPLSFWAEASANTPDAAVLSNYLYQLHRYGSSSEADRLIADLMFQTLPDCRPLFINIAVAQSGIGTNPSPERLRHAQLLLEEVTRRWPDSSDGWRNLGVIYTHTADPRALFCFLRAIAIDPSDSLAHAGAGEWYLLHHEPVSAANHLKQAHDLAPQVDAIRFKWMEALYAAGNERTLQAEQIYCRDRSTIFVTDDMLPDDLRKKV